MPTVARFNVPHVKSLGLEHPESIELTRDGILEDRRFYLVDDTGRLIDGLVAGEVVQVHARTNADGSTLRLTLPDGTVVEDDVRLSDPISTSMYGRTAVGHVVDGAFAAAIEPFARRPVRVVRVDRAGGTREEHHTTIVTDGSLARLAQELGTEALDSRRFRMLIELEGADAHEEDSWLGQTIELGETLLRISAPVPRGASTTRIRRAASATSTRSARSSPTAAFAMAATSTSGYGARSSDPAASASATRSVFADALPRRASRRSASAAHPRRRSIRVSGGPGC